MIIGTGIDIIEIERIKNAVDRRKNFIHRFFTPEEIGYFNSKGKGKMESIAGYFSAKEAIVKSMGTGFSKYKWQDIEIEKTSQGQPKVNLFGKAKIYAQEKGIEDIILSISHSKEYAVAQAIAIGKID